MPKPQLKKDFWEELDKLLGPKGIEPPPNSFTAREFATRKGYKSSGYVSTILRDLVDSGKLLVTTCVVKGRLQNYYYLPK